MRPPLVPACLIALSALFGVAHAAPPTLNAVLECPKKGPHRACLKVFMWGSGLKEDEIDTPLYLRQPRQRFETLWGRLDGGPQTQFRVRVYAEGTPGELNDPPLTAYLGRSSDNNPIILTDRGALEVTSAGIDAAESDFYLIDARRWKLTDRLFAPSRGEFAFTSAARIGVWDEKRALCVTAPTKRPGLLRVAPENCAARPAPIAEQETKSPPPSTPQEGFRLIVQTLIGVDPIPPPPGDPEEVWAQDQARRGQQMGNLIPERTTLRMVQRVLPDAPNEEMGDIDRVWTRWGGMGVGINVFRIKGSNVLVIDYSIDPC